MKLSRFGTVLVAATALGAVLAAPATAKPIETGGAERGAIDRPQRTIPDPDGSGGTDTFAHISCNVQLSLGDIGTKANGLNYPKNTKLMVERILIINGKDDDDEDRVVTNWPFTTRTGSWSVSTNYYSSMVKGTYKLVVRAYRDSNGKLLGTDADTCKF